MFNRHRKNKEKANKSEQLLKEVQDRQPEVDRAEADLIKEYGANKVAFRVARAVRGH